ncbi:A24 family peptidase [Metapseudomonas boanensis]|uniref:Prepilin peptidase n=1 Tax=Metapseudomonas boanensis TaxID=2822138 RepID=A0ABS5XFB2_9GAMM|nr:A24 family peptidase [Pseudomonas boanensis]MBT8766354.1 prepilin peptidase [Pseudomonas boanensis]
MSYPYFSIIALSLFVSLAAVWDCAFKKIPNILVFTGILASFLLYVLDKGASGVSNFLLGVLVGFSTFFPFYFFKGMAAGDVKLMAMVGGYLGPLGAFEAALLALVAGSILGSLILIHKGQLARFVKRYWMMLGLRTYIEPEPDDASRQRFPFAVAILVGTFASYLWKPFAQ